MTYDKREYYKKHKDIYIEKAKQWKLDNPEKAELIIAKASAKQDAKRKIIMAEVQKRKQSKPSKQPTTTLYDIRINRAIRLLAEATLILSEIIKTKATLENAETTIPTTGTGNEATDKQA